LAAGRLWGCAVRSFACLDAASNPVSSIKIQLHKYGYYNISKTIRNRFHPPLLSNVNGDLNPMVISFNLLKRIQFATLQGIREEKTISFHCNRIGGKLSNQQIIHFTSYMELMQAFLLHRKGLGKYRRMSISDFFF
jgi:hypothetical protein